MTSSDSTFDPIAARLTDWRGLALLGLGVGAAAFLAALVSQYGFGLRPCELCLWQRYPYAIGLPLAALGVGLAASRLSAAALAAAALVFAAGLGLAVFHSGVELGWWEGLARCGGAIVTEGSLAEFLEQAKTAPAPRCDARTPFFLGLTMANWNILVSADVAGLLALAAWRRWAGAADR